jgi:hypothetical protein
MISLANSEKTLLEQYWFSFSTAAQTEKIGETNWCKHLMNSLCEKKKIDIKNQLWFF